MITRHSAPLPVAGEVASEAAGEGFLIPSLARFARGKARAFLIPSSATRGRVRVGATS
jgi:hypothetical protein